LWWFRHSFFRFYRFVINNIRSNLTFAQPILRVSSLNGARDFSVVRDFQWFTGRWINLPLREEC
jgi:hypothetical protein